MKLSTSTDVSAQGESLSHFSSRSQTTGLQQIVDDVVIRLDCVAAVAAIKKGNLLVLSDYALNLPPNVMRAWHEWKATAPFDGRQTLSLEDRRHRDNLAVKLFMPVDGRFPQLLASQSLFDLLRPFVDKRLAGRIQSDLGIHQILAAPCLLGDEPVGSLFAVARKPFSDLDADLLAMFGRQAGIMIQSQWRLSAMEALERVILAVQAEMTDETKVLQTIVDAVVKQLGFAGAMVATLESGNSLPVRAYAFDVAPRLIQQLEDKAGVRLIGPKALVKLDEDVYKDNLSVRAIKGMNGRPEKFLISSRMYDLFRPIVNKTFADVTQKFIGIQQVIAVPFFLRDKVVGNLFVMTRRPSFTDWETSILTAFGQQAAVGIRNARFYNEAQEQRRIAEMFGRMAFSATASVHMLRNHISAVHTHINLLSMLSNAAPDQLENVLQRSPAVLERLRKATEVLDNLHEPWQQTPDQLVNVNDSLKRALGEVFPETASRVLAANEIISVSGIAVQLSLMDEPAMVQTPPDMLAEAFRILIKNAVEALLEKGKEHHLWLTSQRLSPTEVEVVIRDSGIGIKPENLANIFKMGWSTKKGQGMGFGLFWARDYITGLGGKIQAESVWQQGTAFHIQLPTAPGSGEV